MSSLHDTRGPGGDDPRAPASLPRLLPFVGGAFAENTWLVIDASGRDAVLVDPGAAAPEALAELERSGAQLRAIVLTHAHIDHVEGIPEVRTRWPDVPLYLHAEDLELYRHAPEQGRWFGVSLGSLPDPDHELVPGQTLEIGSLSFEVAFAPGHAPGHVLLHLREARIALVGDVIFQGSIGRTDLPGGDHETLLTSIEREVLTLPDATRLLPGHGPETTVGRERSTNPFLQGRAGAG